MDMVGPMKVISNSYKYFILITDEYSRYRWITHASKKSEASSNLLDLLKKLVTQYDANKMKLIRTE